MRRAALAFLIGVLISTAVSLSGQSVFPSAIPKVTTLPATCSPTGQTNVVFKTSATIGLYQCLSANTWSAVSIAGAATLAGDNTFTGTNIFNDHDVTIEEDLKLTGLYFDPSLYANTMSAIWPDGKSLYLADESENNWMQFDGDDFYIDMVGQGELKLGNGFTLYGAVENWFQAGASGAATRVVMDMVQAAATIGYTSKMASVNTNNLLWDYGTTLGTVAVTSPGSLTTALTFTQSLAASDFILNNGKALKTDTTTAHTAVVQAYDVDGTAYKTFATLMNGNTPDFTIAPPAGGTVNIQGVYKANDGTAGLTQTCAAAVVALTIKNGLITSVTCP